MSGMIRASDRDASCCARGRALSAKHVPGWKPVLRSNMLPDVRRREIEFALRGQSGGFGAQDPVLADLKRNFFAILQTLLRILLLGHAGADDQAAGQFQLDA